MKKLPKHIFVTGIDTNVGKTVVSSILVQALQADYWKPVQAGNIEATDAETLQTLISTTTSQIHPAAYDLKAPVVPIHAAELEGVEINVSDISLPETSNRLIVEGAGGLMVHLGKDLMVIDLIQHLDLPVILVSKNYLGSINHTLLSIEALQRRGIEILGIIYCGDRSEHMRSLVFDSTGVPEIGSIETTDVVNKDFINEQAKHLLSSFKKYFVIE